MKIEKSCPSDMIFGDRDNLLMNVVENLRRPYDQEKHEYDLAALTFMRLYPQVSIENGKPFFRNICNGLTPFELDSKTFERDFETQICTRQTGRGCSTRVFMTRQNEEITLLMYANRENKDGTGEYDYYVNDELYRIVQGTLEEKERIIQLSN